MTEVNLFRVALQHDDDPPGYVCDHARIGKLVGAELAARLPATLACACLAVAAGVQIVRAHDVAETVQAIRMTEAILAKRKA